MASGGYKVEKRIELSYHPRAECAEDDCGFATPPGPSAREHAKTHVKATGHHVQVITEKIAEYAPRE